ncbi:class I SAM-dependent methyltransferase [Thioclava sp. GXIMD4215]|uniref:class I SAM-dependent methyltransferase n=1 Tax=Thioclava sp. GXIMD4215 TaxID=3131928 RepID=UPI003244B7AB
MGVFDFLHSVREYKESEGSIVRLEKRYSKIIKPIESQFCDASVLDLGAHDGRWSYVFSKLGTSRVTGVEGRRHLIDRFNLFPDSKNVAQTTLIHANIFDFLEQAIEDGIRYDIVCVLGIFYHIADHHRLLRLIKALEPKLVILDSDFTLSTEPEISLIKENVNFDLNAIPTYDGQINTVVGIPSFRAMEEMCDQIGFDILWQDWDTFSPDQRTFIEDYYLKNSGKRAPDKIRSSCYLSIRT